MTGQEIQEKNEKVFRYYRVSTEMQKLDMQKKSVKDFLKNREHIEVIESFTDEAISGALGWERPAFREMMEKIDKVDGIILYDWDRLSREEEFAVNLMYSLKNKNKFVYESNTGQKLDFNIMHNRLIGFIKSINASEERIRTKKRQKDGIKAYKEKHDRWGPHKKFGNNLSGKKLPETSFWRLYEQYRMANISKAGIARILKISRQTLYKRLNENLDKYNEIELKIK